MQILIIIGSSVVTLCADNKISQPVVELTLKEAPEGVPEDPGTLLRPQMGAVLMKDMRNSSNWSTPLGIFLVPDELYITIAACTQTIDH